MVKAVIVGHGVYLPRERIPSDRVLKSRFRHDPKVREDPGLLSRMIGRVKDGLLLNYKYVPGFCEDTTTILAEASDNALRMAHVLAGIEPGDIGAVYFGSESKPYAVGQMAIEMASFFGIPKKIFTDDGESACNAGMNAGSHGRSKVLSGEVRATLTGGGDVAQAPVKTDLEWACSGGGGAFVIASDELVRERNHDAEYYIAELYDVVPWGEKLRDFQRREGQKWPKFYGDTTAYSYQNAVIHVLMEFFKKHPEMKLAGFDGLVMHGPNDYTQNKTLRALSKEGIDKTKESVNKTIHENKTPARSDLLLLDLAEEIESEGLMEQMILAPQRKKEIVDPLQTSGQVGNTYAGSTPMGVSNALDQLPAGADLLAVSFGSGNSALATWIKTTDGIERSRGIVPSLSDYINRAVDIKIGNYKQLLEERFRRWVKKHLMFPKIQAYIEPADDNDGFLEISICSDCGVIYYPKMDWCLDEGSHKKYEMIKKELPKIARLKRLHEAGKIESVKQSSADVLKDDRVIIVDASYKDLHDGISLEPVIRRLDYAGEDGLISYGPAYRPLFRNQPKYFSQMELLRQELAEAPLLAQ